MCLNSATETTYLIWAIRAASHGASGAWRCSVGGRLSSQLLCRCSRHAATLRQSVRALIFETASGSVPGLARPGSARLGRCCVVVAAAGASLEGAVYKTWRQLCPTSCTICLLTIRRHSSTPQDAALIARRRQNRPGWHRQTDEGRW